MTRDHSPSGSNGLDAALAAHPEGAELRRVWDAIPQAGASSGDDPSADERGAAWSRLRTAIHDPSRRPFTSDVGAPIQIVADDVQDGANAEAGVDGSVLTIRTRAVPTMVSMRRWRVAAAVIGVLVAGGAGIRAVPITYEASVIARNGTALGAAGPVRALRLADGSDVWLAAGSRLSVPRALGWPRWLRASSRSVLLTGRAFFSVQRDGRPFEVHTSDATVRVLGTRFDVRSPTNVSGSQVAVEEGRVSVASAGSTRDRSDAAVELGAGQRIVVQRGAVAASAVQTVSIARVASWRTGGLAALDEPLDGVLDELARRYAVEITHAPDVDVTVTVSLFYPSAPTIETVLADLCTAQGLSFQRTSRGYHVARSEVRP